MDNNKTIIKKIAFCITCMNRLSHIQQTLAQNIEDNFLPDDVEFILMDYNSTDGLEEWVKALQKHINIGILHYYKTDIPLHYNRSHSRNMAFRLANAEILCNLDADNFLGEGFAKYILHEFEKLGKDRIYITSSFQNLDAFGRVCVRTSDFYNIHGYNEILAGYGNEDTDLFYRLQQSGLQLKPFSNKTFCRAIPHSHLERIKNEFRYKQYKSLYLSYESPYKLFFLIIYKNGLYESGSLINNELCNFNHNKYFSNVVEKFFDDVFRVMLDSPLLKGKRQFPDYETITVNDSIYYKIEDETIVSDFIVQLSDADNFETIQKSINNQGVVNPTGFGQGIVYKNFDYTNPIILD